MKTHFFKENLVFHGFAFPAEEIEDFLGHGLSQSPFLPRTILLFWATYVFIALCLIYGRHDQKNVLKIYEL